MLSGFESLLVSIESVMWTWIGVPVLIITAVTFTVMTKGIQFRRIPQMVRTMFDKSGTDEEGRSEVSAFKSFCMSAASRVGTGNIAGVAVAIAAGGPGAIFWMWIMGLLVGSTSMIESTLAQVFKIRGDDGFRGGPAYYMRQGLGKPWMAVAFAILISVVYGFVFNSIQANSIVDAMKGSFPSMNVTLLSGIIAVVLVVLTAPIIFGGVRRIANISAVVVPASAAVYLVICAVVIVLNIARVPDVFALIVREAFAPQPIAGAALGFGVVLMTGVQRGLFSNEAGMGSVPNAAAAASVTHPAKQGLVQTLGVYFDTLFLCTVTAVVVLLSDWRQFMEDQAGALGAGAMTQNAISESFDAIGPIMGASSMHLVTICIFFFAGTSLFGNYYYGETNILYIAGDRPWSRWLLHGFRVTVLFFVVFGAMVPVSLVWALGNVAMPFMAFLNIAAILMLAPVALKVLRHYDSQVDDGRDPQFTADVLPGVPGVRAWPADDSTSAPPDRSAAGG